MELENDSPTSTLYSVWAGTVAVLALVLIGFGLWALGGAIYAAWGLFRNPDGIAYFATYFLETTRIASYLPSGAEGLAHFASWLAVVLLLLVLGKLGAWAVDAGAKLLHLRSRHNR